MLSRNPFASINVTWKVFIWKHLVLLILPTLSLLQRNIGQCLKKSAGTLTGHFIKYTFPVQGHLKRKMAGEPIYIFLFIASMLDACLETLFWRREVVATSGYFLFSFCGLQPVWPFPSDPWHQHAIFNAPDIFSFSGLLTVTPRGGCKQSEIPGCQGKTQTRLSWMLLYTLNVTQT